MNSLGERAVLVDVIKKLGGADAVVATAVSLRAYEQGSGPLKRGGRLSCSWGS